MQCLLSMCTQCHSLFTDGCGVWSPLLHFPASLLPPMLAIRSLLSPEQCHFRTQWSSRSPISDNHGRQCQRLQRSSVSEITKVTILGHKRSQRSKAVPTLPCVKPPTDAGCEVTAVVLACWSTDLTRFLAQELNREWTERQEEYNVYVRFKIFYTHTVHASVISTD